MSHAKYRQKLDRSVSIRQARRAGVAGQNEAGGNRELTGNGNILARFCTLLAVAAIGYFLLWPLVMLVIGAIRTSPYGTQGSWTLEGFATVFSDPRTAGTLLATVFYAAIATAGCMALGLWFVTVVTRFATPLARLLTPAMVVLVATPRLFYALSWGMLGNPNSGLFARALHALGVVELPDWLTVYSWAGLLTVTALKLTAFAYLLLYGPACRIDRSLEDAAVMSGVPRSRAFREITLGTLTPALLAAAMLIFVDVMQVFDLPAILGMPAGIHTLPVRVNDYLLESGQPNWAAASALSLVVVVIIAILLQLQRLITRGRDYVTVSGKAAPAEVTAIGGWRWLVDVSIIAFIVIGIGLPIVQIVIGSFQPFFGLYGVWTLANYASLLDDDLARRTMVVTLGIAVGGGLITVLAAFGMAYVMQRRRGTALALLSRIGSWVPACAPGIVLSLALLWSYLNTPFLGRLFGTPWLILLALIVGSIPIAVRAIEGIVAQVSPEVEEAARMSGARAVSAVAEITARICTPALLAAWFLVGLSISGTLDIPLLLQSTDSQTVATLAYSLYTYGHVPQAAALFCMYLVLALASVGLAIAVGLVLRRLLAFRRPELRHAEG
jgi:iron(III) transport system permease protein